MVSAGDRAAAFATLGEVLIDVANAATAAGMLMVAGPLTACAVTSHNLIRSVGACELNSDVK